MIKGHTVAVASGFIVKGLVAITSGSAALASDLLNLLTMSRASV